MSTAETLVWALQIWGIAGAVVAVVFLTVGIGQIDEDARDALTFRALVVPGIIVIWPLVLWRWWVLATGRDQWKARHAPPRRSHAVVAFALLVLIPLTLLTAYAIRQTWPADIAPERLETGTRP